MTISTTSNKAQWAGNGTASVFPFSFEIGNANEATLYFTDTTGAVTPIQPSSYSIAGLGSPSGGTITYPLSGTPIASGTELTLVRTVPLQQLTDLQNQSNYFPDAVEGALDYTMMAIQQLAAGISSSLQAPPADTSPNMVLPPAAQRANMVLGFDGNGNPMMLLAAGSSGPVTASNVTFDSTTLAAQLLSRINRVVDSHLSLRSLASGTYTRAFCTAALSAAAGGGGPYKAMPTDTTSGAVFTASVSGSTMTVSSVASGALAVGQVVNWKNGTESVYISALGTGSGGAGTYTLSATAAVSSQTMTADNGGTVLVAFDGMRWYLQWNGPVATSQFGATSAGDATFAAQAALNYAVTAQSIWIDQTLTVSSLTVQNASGLTIFSSGSLTGNATTNTDAVLTIKNSLDVSIVGRLPVSANYNTHYACAVAVYTDNSTQAAKINLRNVMPVGAQLGFRFGLSSAPGALVSEIVVDSGYAYGCPSFLAAYGTQTVIDVDSYQAVSDLGSNPAGWSSLNRQLIHVYGAQVRVRGGEAILADVSTGELCIIEPIADPVNGNQYGSVAFTGVEIECASQWCLIQNPGAIGSLAAGMGGLSITNCKGVHTQNSFAMVQSTDNAFPGTIKIDESNKFFCTVARSQANVNCSGTACHIYVDDSAFGTNFVQGLSGLVGGVVHFRRRKILDTQNTNSQSFVNATATTVVYTVNNSDINTARFTGQYSTSTGVFTVPAGGLLDVEVFATLHTTLPANPLDLQVQVNGSQRTPWPTSMGGASCNGWVGGHTMIGNLNAGDLVKIVATQSGGSNSNGNGTSFEKFVIYARN